MVSASGSTRSVTTVWTAVTNPMSWSAVSRPRLGILALPPEGGPLPQSKSYQDSLLRTSVDIKLVIRVRDFLCFAFKNSFRVVVFVCTLTPTELVSKATEKSEHFDSSPGLT
jgi:hypothetical protein